MNIFFHELKSNFRSIITWTLSILLLNAVFLGIYPVYSDAAGEVQKLISGYPPALLKALGFDPGLVFSPIGFYSFIFTYTLLCGSIQAMILGVSLISKEFNRKTADFLLTKPVSRSAVLTGKLMSGLVSLLVTDIVVITSIWFIITLTISEPFSFKPYILLSLTLFYVEMMFYALGILAAVIIQRIKSVIGVSIGTVFTFFALGMVSAAFDDDKMRYFMPFKYYDPIKIIGEMKYEPVFVAINVIFVVICVLLSYVIYTKRDIHSV